MYLRAILCTFQISVDFYYVPVGGRGGGAGERGMESIMSECSVSAVAILTAPYSRVSDPH
jgi:hypothetical protein